MYHTYRLSNWIHLSVGQVDCKNHLSECTIHLSEIYKANATYVKIRNMQSSVGHVLLVFHLSDCHFYSSHTIGRVKFWTLYIHCTGLCVIWLFSNDAIWCQKLRLTLTLTGNGLVPHGTRQLPEPILAFCHRIKFSEIWEKKQTNFLVQENAFEIVIYKMKLFCFLAL